MRISIIVAVARNGVIGRDNDLVWRLRDDMKFFSETTKGHAVLTGRRNYESIPERFRPLPNRANIVITRNSKYEATGADVAYSLEAGIDCAKAMGVGDLFIIGGGQIYAESMSKGWVNRLFITHVDAAPEGDTFFDLGTLSANWKEIAIISDQKADDRNEHAFRIAEYHPSQA
jgi:dihydrofolate reductase